MIKKIIGKRIGFIALDEYGYIISRIYFQKKQAEKILISRNIKGSIESVYKEIKDEDS